MNDTTSPNPQEQPDILKQLTQLIDDLQEESQQHKNHIQDLERKLVTISQRLFRVEPNNTITTINKNFKDTNQKLLHGEPTPSELYEQFQISLRIAQKRHNESIRAIQTQAAWDNERIIKLEAQVQNIQKLNQIINTLTTRITLLEQKNKEQTPRQDN